MEKRASCGGKFDFGGKQTREQRSIPSVQQERDGSCCSGGLKGPILRPLVNIVADVTCAVGCSPGPAPQFWGSCSPAAQSAAC